MKPLDKLATLVSLCKRRGFVYPGSEIYGGLSGSFDYGPLGTQLKLNLKNEWWKHFVGRRPRQCFGVETGILLSPKVWERSGHVANFSDKMCECMHCKKRIRADHHIAAITKRDVSAGEIDAEVARLRHEQKWKCPGCGKSDSLGDAKDFNLLFQTSVGATASANDDSNKAYFRPETAQGVYVNLANLMKSTRKTAVPFGFASTGTVFRNEVSPRDFIFRTREFEQLELQWFCANTNSEQDRQYWIQQALEFCHSVCGLHPDKIRVRDHDASELAHYSLATSDLEYDYPGNGFGEFWGVSNRGSHDLECHYPADKLPVQDCHIIEPSLGLNRLLLAVLCDAYAVDDTGRVLLRLTPELAPFQCAVFPVIASNAVQMERAWDLAKLLLEWDCRVDVDESGASVGKKYRRQDEIGTPISIVVDEQTLADGTVTLRDRDSMRQVRVPQRELASKQGFFKATQLF